MSIAESDRALQIVIVQAACLIGGALLLVAASVLFAALMVSTDLGPGFAVTALINTALFYIWGMGCFSHVMRTWRTAGKRAADAPLEKGQAIEATSRSA